MSYSNGLLQTSNNISGKRGPPGPAGQKGVGFNLDSAGNFLLDSKRLYHLETPSDVPFTASISTTAKDQSSAVNKGYLKTKCLTLDRTDAYYDLNQNVIRNTEPYHDGLFGDRDLISKEYVDKMDTELETKLNTSHIQSANRKNVFKYIMEDPTNQIELSSYAELGGIVIYQESPHQINKNVIDMKLELDLVGQDHYNARFGLNLTPLVIIHFVSSFYGQTVI